METESDRFIIQTAGSGDDENSQSRVSLESIDTPGTPRSLVDLADATQVAWEIDKPIRLAVEYRHSSSVVISFITRSKVVKKKKVLAIALVRLDKCQDGELCSYTVPVFETSEVKDAIKGNIEWLRGSSVPSTPSLQRKSSSSRRISRGSDARVIGYISLDLVVHPGISRAHKKIGKKDLRFARVYEAWESYRDVVNRRAATRQDKMIWSGNPEVTGEADDVGESDSSSDDGDSDDDHGLKRTTSERELLEEPEKKEGFFAEQKAHSKALHKKVSQPPIAQLAPSVR